MKTLLLRAAVAVTALWSCAILRAQSPPESLKVEPPKPEGLSMLGRNAAGNPDAAATVVVFNETDPEAALLAKFYADKRGIPPGQIVGLKCSGAEEISREEYESTLAEPLRQIFTQKGWWKLLDIENPRGPIDSTTIRYVALIRGIPVRIAAAATWEGDKAGGPPPVFTQNAAAVDSELATLAQRKRVISGPLINGYYGKLTAFRDAARLEMMLVCRLDGPSAPIVRRMILDGLAAEQTGLRGFIYLDAQNVTDQNMKPGDQWLYNIAEDSRKNGLPVILDNGPSMFPANYPMRYAAMYFGWYSEQPAGPFARPGFRFLPGAVAVHIHSFSGSNVRSDKLNWVGPLLNLGAAATLGNVYEPYLALTPNLDIFEQRLRLGFNFAEAAYMSQRFLSWMTTFVGDPLYRPFPLVPEKPGAKNTVEWEAYRQGALVWLKDRAEGRRALEDAARKLRSGIIWEAAGLLEMGGNDRTAAIADLQEGRKTYTNADDVLRCAIHEVIQLRAAGREPEAEKLARAMVKAYPVAPALTVLRMVVPGAFLQ